MGHGSGARVRRCAHLASILVTSIEGLPVEEAAVQLNTRSGNIYFARSRVMARIKELVQQYQDPR